MKTRTIKELLQILLDNIDCIKIARYKCLCALILYLYCIDKITWKEYILIYKYIKNNIPINAWNPYGWKPRLILPRKKWLKEHIELLSKK